MKKGYYVIIGILIIVLGVFLYLHFKTEKVSVDESIAKSESPIDLATHYCQTSKDGKRRFGRFVQIADRKN